MPIPIGIMIGMQAAGMVVDWLGTNEQIEMSKYGAQLEQEQINRDINASRLAAEDESLQAMRKLRQNLGTQAVMLAARGVRAGAGTALTFSQESLSNFNADERMRKINQMSREASFRTQKKIAELHTDTTQKSLWNSFVNRQVQKVPTSPEAWEQIGKGFGIK